MRFAKLTFAGALVADESSQLSALDMQKGLVALRARHLEPGVGLSERGLDLRCRLEAVDLTKSTSSGELSRELTESGAETTADGD